MDAAVSPVLAAIEPVEDDTAIEPGSGLPDILPIPVTEPAPSYAAEPMDPLRANRMGELDVRRYETVFELQEEGYWSAADKVVRRIEDRRLMGRVLYQRYMHPTKYRSRYLELYNWLKDYASEPGADLIYRLALKRRPANYKAPRKPPVLEALGARPAETAPRTGRDSRQARSVKAQISRNLRRGRPDLADNALDTRDAKRYLSDTDYDEARTEISASYFFKGEFERALSLAQEAAARSRADVPLADWRAGLAAWGLERYRLAALHFQAAAAADGTSGWTRAASAYWGARAELLSENPAAVMPLLLSAARHPHTFYGLLANRQLGAEPAFDWRDVKADPVLVSSLDSLPAVRRAVALAQAGQHYWAERELREIRGMVRDMLGTETGDRALVELAAALRLPAAQLRFGDQKWENGGVADSVLYPVPDWRPEGGFTIDRAFLYAVMRQESRFNVRAQSHAGARGLMQLMPRTASYVAGDRTLRWDNRFRLFDPEFNITLGQNYLTYLMGRKEFHNDLLLATAAYNGGPGNLRKWLRRMDHKNDPLLFLEMIPSRETRLYVQRVLTNFWIYRDRLGQRSPSLDRITTGEWPIYEALDETTIAIEGGG